MAALDDASCRPLRASEFAKIRQLAYNAFGLDLRAGKETLVSARLGKDMRKSGFRSFDEYYQHVVGDCTGEALIHLIDSLTTNHTAFFREPAHFDFLRKTLLPEWKQGGPIEIWSAACATGEEPYSIAMCILDELGAAAYGRLRILATDISSRVLTAAEKGIFRPTASKSSPRCSFGAFGCAAKASGPAAIARRKNSGQPSSSAGSICWSRCFTCGRFPLIFCRNVMIYFDKKTQERVVEQLAGCLAAGRFSAHRPR